MHRARNPLTDEELLIREVINEIVDSAQLGVLQALNDLSTPADQSEVANHADVSRQVVSSHLSVFYDRGWANLREGGPKITTGGRLLLNTMENCLRTVAHEPLSYLTRSDYPIMVLKELGRYPRRIRELGAIDDLPSQATIRRIIAGFVEQNWLETTSGKHHITQTGTEVLQVYEELSTAIEQIIEKAPLLQRLPVDVPSILVGELSDADFCVSNPRNPASVLSTCIKLYDPNISRFRCLCSVYNPVLFQAYRGLLELGIEAEAILDWPTAVKAANSSGNRYSVDSKRYTNYQPLVLEDAHSLGIGLYDDRKVAIAAYNEVGNGTRIAMIVSSNPQLVKWVIDLYKSYRAEAIPASEMSLTQESEQVQ